LRSQIDLFPTVLELLDVEWEGVLPGRSLLQEQGHEHLLASCWYTDFCTAGRTADLKLIYHFGRQPPELYDLAADPTERRDLARDPAWASRRRELEAWLISYKASIDGFYRQHPEKQGPENWWREDTVRTPAP
jgi:arylsulfatase A-like enzyme